METMEAYAGKMETRLKHWGSKLDELFAKAQEAGAEAKSDYQKRVVDLKAKHQAAQSKLDEAKAAGSKRWKGLKSGVQKAWDDLEIAFKSPASATSQTSAARPTIPAEEGS